MRTAAIVAPLLLAACGGDPAVPAAPGQARANSQGGQIVDLADALSLQEERALADRLAGQQAAGRAVMVVVIRPDKQQSLEQVGWAVGGGAAEAAGRLLLLVDPVTRRVRVEGDLLPVQKAEVAAAMTDDLSAGRTAAAIGRGLTRIGQFAS